MSWVLRSLLVIALAVICVLVLQLSKSAPPAQNAVKEVSQIEYQPPPSREHEDAPLVAKRDQDKDTTPNERSDQRSEVKASSPRDGLAPRDLLGDEHSRKTPLQRIAEGATLARGAFRGEYGWRFKEYVSSKLELDFYEDVKPYLQDKEWIALGQRYAARVEKLVQDSKGYVAPDSAFRGDMSFSSDCSAYRNRSLAGDTVGAGRTCLGRQDALDPELFSRFIYEFVCLEEPCVDDVPAGYRIGEQHTSFIEPLFGTMRHPQFFSRGGDAAYVLNKEYMIPDKWAMHNLNTRWKKAAAPKKLRQRSFFIDMGASLYTSGAGGASQNWFVGLANCLCVPFTEMHLFEATSQEAHRTWSEIPDYLHPHYRWYNYPLSPDIASWRNPLNHLLLKSAPGDVVVVKVDFDSLGLEREIIETVLKTPDLYQWIDELFFEYHVQMAYLHNWWGSVMDKTQDVRNSIDVFRGLRQRGIRSHSWV